MMRNRLRHRARDERGFTLVETIAAMFILLVGVLATAQIIDASSNANAANRQRDGATNVARELVEAARGVPYEKVSATGVTTALQAIPGLQDTPGAGYVIRRDGVDYTVVIDVCIMDDAKDGGGTRPSSATFCANSVAPGTVDKNPEDYKRVTVTTTWRRDGRESRVVQSGVVNNPGSASGPAIRTLIPRGLLPPSYVVTSSTTSVIFDVTTSSRPDAGNWLLDGTVKGPLIENGTTGLAWMFTWNIGPVDTGTLDGQYIVAAEAVRQGVSGPGRSETIVLNRRKPFAPQQVTGGRTNFGTVEIEWTANRERDIVGYQVVRVTPDDPDTVVCPLVTQQLVTTCVDTAPPDVANVGYVVYAYDRDPMTGSPRAGDVSQTREVTKTNTPPFPPTNPTATRADDIVTLTWQRPVPEDPDADDGIEFYRIYRDGKALGDRYERWFDPRATAIWQDTRTGGLAHTYWITAVDKSYAESPFLGPVTK